MAINVLAGRPQGKTIVAQLEGIDTPEQGSVLVGAKIAVSREAMPELDVGEYYWADLAGMMVRTVEAVEIGPVIRLFETGANDVMVVSDIREDLSGTKEILVPWLVPDVVTNVDSDERVITIDWDPDF
jgi:16S rRNA processing protein RimM